MLSNLFTQLHREHLKRRGFKKVRFTFSRDASAYVERFNFQGSAWSSATEKRFYINIGIWFPEYGDDTSGSLFPGNHWAARIERLVPEAPPHWDVHAGTDFAVLSAELARLIDAAGLELAARVGHCRDEYLQRQKRVAAGRAAEV